MLSTPLKVGDKLTFQWKPGYRGPLRDGETVYVVAIEEQLVKVRYRLQQVETLRPELLYRWGPKASVDAPQSWLWKEPIVGVYLNTGSLNGKNAPTKKVLFPSNFLMH